MLLAISFTTLLKLITKNVNYITLKAHNVPNYSQRLLVFLIGDKSSAVNAHKCESPVNTQQTGILV
jgi:hypothetical protein